MKDFENTKISDLKIKIINNTIIFGTITGFITFFVSLLNYNRIDFKLGFLLDFLVLITFSTTVYLRNKLSLQTKSIILIICILCLVYTDMYKYGLFSDNKYFLVVLPFFTFLAFNLKNTIRVFIFSILIYCVFGVLFIIGILKPHTDYYARSIAIDPWIINLCITSLIAIVFLLVLHQFISNFEKLITELRNQNKELSNYKENLEKIVLERTHELEAANEELHANNEELFDKNKIIISQNNELQKTMNKLKKTQTNLIQSEKMASLGILTAGVAHEINNPLNFIQGSYEGLKNHFDELGQLEDTKISLLLNSIDTGINRASTIVKSLHQFSNNNESFTDNCEIHSIIENSLVLLHSELSNEIIIIKKLYKDAIIINGNSGKLLQVFINIITNAIHAINGKGKITISTKQNKTNVIIKISDSGIGISKENLSKITNPFFTTKAPGKGTGLGLSITYSIIQEHNGKIEFESEIDKGTTVTLILPIKD